MTQTDDYWEALVSRDPRLEGVFYYAVVTTGVYCRPTCKSRLPKRENVRFFDDPTTAERAGFRPCKRCRPLDPTAPDARAQMVEKACRLIQSHAGEPVTLAALGRDLHVSPFHLQRTFKEVTGVTPKAYADTCRIQLLKTGLQDGHSVTRALYDAGYGSSSRLYESADAHLGMTPAAYRKGGAGLTIRYSVVDSPAGKLLVAATERGVCSIQFGDSASELRDALAAEFGSSVLVEEAPGPAAKAIVEHLEGHPLRAPLPLDIRATAFQRRVWEHLQTIPYGQTESYGEVARQIGQPSASRAVARACATNPVAVAIPCHRVVRNDGGLGGYRWKIERKKALLDKERLG
jgi:AraC family transcriptional regulator of adaptative response/methylated-DNA-[protein]-cysteine methyltransferase